MLSHMSLVYETTRRWGHLPNQTLSDGTMRVARLPETFEDYLFEFPPPATELMISCSDRDLKMLTGMAIPAALVDFYRVHNGCSLFCGAISILGLPGDVFARASKGTAQVHNLLTRAIAPDVPAPQGRDLTIAVYDNHTHALIRPDGTIGRVPDLRPDMVLNTWRCLDDWVLCETARLADQFAADGTRQNAFGQSQTASGKNPKSGHRPVAARLSGMVQRLRPRFPG
ncbi:SMI1/KNR4 family protein [Roseibium sp. RKSG952]|uniref:SMI1/KNR4 family protein n=1 Tax=Roseibium sp. RKSG952 TaxID=2529384 RepID=UPI0012BD4B5B|nr:SMI1/KNR4 family protein [Roseibium sp. RKSG952]MTH98231.1 hypothetical protein [Roseibium sp. RKSG952]